MILPDQERRGENGVRTLPPIPLLSGRTYYFEEYLQKRASGADVSALGRAIARSGLKTSEKRSDESHVDRSRGSRFSVCGFHFHGKMHLRGPSVGAARGEHGPNRASQNI